MCHARPRDLVKLPGEEREWHVQIDPQVDAAGGEEGGGQDGAVRDQQRRHQRHRLEEERIDGVAHLDALVHEAAEGGKGEEEGEAGGGHGGALCRDHGRTKRVSVVVVVVAAASAAAIVLYPVHGGPSEGVGGTTEEQ